MLSNYFIVSLRSLFRHKVYSIINIVGLAVGISFFTLLVLLIRYEINYDTLHRFHERIYRVTKITNSRGMGEKTATVPFPLGTTLQWQYPDYVESYVRVFNFQVPSHALGFGDARYNESGFYFADETFFDVFDYPLALGDPQTALAEPLSVIISHQAKEKYFGDTNPLGKQLIYEDNTLLTVTGVFAEKSWASHFEFDFIASMNTVSRLNVDLQQLQNNWKWDPAWTYVLLENSKSPEDLEFLLEDLVHTYFPEAIKAQTTLLLQPLTEIHLYSDLEFELSPTGDVKYVFIFAALAILILVITQVNFTNLSSARSALRAREIGIRKAIGADQFELVQQFATEFLIISVLAILLGFMLIELMLPLLSDIAGIALTYSRINKNILFASVAIAGLLLWLVYPVYLGFYLTRFYPAEMLTGSMLPKVKSRRFRGVLIVIQFVITGFLLITTFISLNQFRYLKNTDPGFQKENIVVLPVANTDIRFQFEEFRQELLQHAEVIAVTGSEEVLGLGHRTHDYHLEIPGKSYPWMFFPALIVRDNFPEVFDIELVAGRSFANSPQNDEYNAIIINEKTVEYFGWKSPEEAIGKTLRSRSGGERIIGVAKNFNFESLHNEVSPFIIDMASDKFQFFFTRYVSVKVKEGQETAALAHIRSTWKGYVPNRSFEYFYLSEALDELYARERKLGEIMAYFALVAIFIACLGLYGLSSFVVNMRNKEIAIRKAIGTTDRAVFFLLLREFFSLVGLAILISMPISWLVMDNWLKSFPFHTSIGVAPYVTTIIVAFMVTLFTVSFHTIKAARREPVQALQL